MLSALTVLGYVPRMSITSNQAFNIFLSTKHLYVMIMTTLNRCCPLVVCELEVLLKERDMEKQQQKRPETAKTGHDLAGEHVDAGTEIRRWYDNLSPQQAADILENDSSADDYAPIRSLATHYQGPWLDGSLTKLLAIAGETSPSQKARTNQSAIAKSVATKWAGELSSTATDELIDISLATGSVVG